MKRVIFSVTRVPMFKYIIQCFNLVDFICLLVLLNIIFLSLFRLYGDYRNKKSKALGKHVYFYIYIPESIMTCQRFIDYKRLSGII